MAKAGTTTELGHRTDWKPLMQYTNPAITVMTASSTLQHGDSIFIGHGVGPWLFQGLAISPLMNLAAAFGSLVGRCGVRLCLSDWDKRLWYPANIFWVNHHPESIIGIGFTILTLLPRPYSLFFRASADTISYARDYMYIILLGNVVTHVPRIERFASGIRTSAKGNDSPITTVIINTLLDLSSFYIFKWGVEGAAIATYPGTNHFIDMAVQNLPTKTNCSICATAFTNCAAAS